jgi:peptide/nickel transport system substrate-binding protein
MFNFQQWLSPEIGSSMLDLLSYLDRAGVEKVDDYTVRLHLNEAQIGVPEHLFHYPALILPHTFEGDFIRQPIGTGPFTLEEYTPGERARFKRRNDYWQNGADDQPLPYLDEIIYLDLSADNRLAAMQGGLVDTIYVPRPTDWQALQNTPQIAVHGISTAQTFVLRMRADQEPWTDVRVRQALKLCQDRQAILDLSYFGQGDLGIDAHIAPVHPAYCPQPIPKYDPERARSLLEEAGYPDGLTITLTTKNDQGEPAIAQGLKELAAPGGFNIQLNIVEPARYWEQWTDVNLGITTWAHRPLDTMVLALGYVANTAWNETHWHDEEFAALLRQAERTLDIPARREIMCQLEEIMQERGPIGISYWRKGWLLIREEFQNVQAHPTGYDLFYDVWRTTS